MSESVEEDRDVHMGQEVRSSMHRGLVDTFPVVGVVMVVRGEQVGERTHNLGYNWGEGVLGEEDPEN